MSKPRNSSSMSSSHCSRDHNGSTNTITRASSVSSLSGQGRRRSLSANRLPISKFNTDRVVLNIGGKKFTTLRSTLKTVPNTLLYELEYFDEYYDDLKQEYFFDRSAEMFEYVLNYHRTGELHFSHNLCPGLVQKELKFWRIKEHWLEDCCWTRLMEHFERRKAEIVIENVIRKTEEKSFFGQASHVCKLCTNKMEHDHPTTPKEVAVKVAKRIYTTYNLLRMAVRESVSELTFFFGIVLFSMISFAVVMRIVERNVPDLITGMWWAVVTMTTVGYGDVHPNNTLGYIFGSLCAFVGVGCVAIILPVVANRFVRYTDQLDNQLYLRNGRHKVSHHHGHVTNSVGDGYPNKKKT